MNGRSLLDVAHQIAVEKHGELLDKLERADRELRELAGDKPRHELAQTLADEALELLRGPRPNYGEALSALDMAAMIDGRYTAHWHVVDGQYKESVRLAMARVLDEADREDEALLPPREAVN